jgi:sulfate transport system substrate-binding protein
MPGTRRRRRTLAAALTVTAAASLALGGCGSDSDDASATASESAPTTINVVGFAVIESVYEALADAFAQTEAGAGFAIKGSYGPSGDQSRAVAAGAKADLVEFSVEPDLTRLVDAGLVAEDWADGPTTGIASTSVVVLVVRPGNPKGITGWDDIAKDGVDIVTADPTRSGAAKWNLLGAYAHGLGATGAGADTKQAEDFLGDVVDNVTVWAESGRKATEAFTSGTGDVLLSYENEAILARQSGEDVDYVLPDDTFLIENPAAVTTTAPPVASTFLDFVLSPEGQQIFASKGFRPLGDGVDPGTVEGANDPANPFPTPDRVTTVADLGGWDKVNALLFDEGALVPTLQAE